MEIQILFQNFLAMFNQVQKYTHKISELYIFKLLLK